MTRQTVRVALRDAMAEEMRCDKDVFIMGEEAIKNIETDIKALINEAAEFARAGCK